MGYCQLIPIRNKKPQPGIEFRNPWRGAARIWTSLYDRYLKNPNEKYDSWLSTYSKDQGKPLWDLAKRDTLQMFARSVHAFTFDRAYVLRKDFARFAADLELFEKEFPVDYPSHLPAWSNVIRELDADAVGLHGTSVSENPWWRYDEKKDRNIAYKLKDGFDVYAWLYEISKEQAVA